MRFYNGKEYEPRVHDKEHIDWRTKHIGELAMQGDQMPPPLRFECGDYDIEITPETGGAVVNQMCDPMDCLWVVDIRDGTKWMIFRDEMDNDYFNNMLGAMQFHGLVNQTYEPSPLVEDIYWNRKVGDLSKADTFPEAWLAPPASA